jgi:hypothetical protein
VTTVTENDLTSLGERARQLRDRVDELRAQAIAITDDIAVARQDWVDAVELGEDGALLAQRCRLREGELLDNRQAAEHLQRLLGEVDAEIADIEARAQLAADVQRYHEARIDFNADLPGLVEALPDTVAVIGDALDALTGEVDIARTTHDQLVASAGQLRQRAEQLGVEHHLPDPADWSAGLSKIDKDGPLRQLSLALMQRRGIQAVISEITRLIMLDAEAKRKAAR